MIEVNLQIKHISFSAHADAKGILQLIRQCDPAHVCLVHGEAGKMSVLMDSVVKEFGVGCYMPANGATVVIDKVPVVEIDVSSALVKQAWKDAFHIDDRLAQGADNNLGVGDFCGVDEQLRQIALKASVSQVPINGILQRSIGQVHHLLFLI